MDLIANVLIFVRDQLNGFFRSVDPAGDVQVVLSNLIDHDGKPSQAARNKLVMVLTNIVVDPASARSSTPPPLTVDLHVLFFANFDGDRYVDGLRAIAGAIRFLHEHPVFARAGSPGLSAGIDTFSMAKVELDEAAWSDVMRMHGVRYLPSACYALRTAPIA